MSKKYTLHGTGIEVEIGGYAGLADGAAWIKCGGNIVLATVVATKDEKDFMGFFPLTVEYREKTSAAGRIPGGYFKREGRLSDVEILTCRVIDRSIRPFFPSNYFNEVQLLTTVYSSDGKSPLSVLSLLGASIALSISSIPFKAPVGAVQVLRIDGKWMFNRGFEEAEQSDVQVLVAGTKEGVCMVEGTCDLLSEDEVVDLLFSAHEEIKKQIAWQEDIVREVGKAKVNPASSVNWDVWQKRVGEWCTTNVVTDAFFRPTKFEQNAAIREKKNAFKAHFAEALDNNEVSYSVLSYLFDNALKSLLPDVIVQKNKRFDGRDFDKVRPISAKVGLLPQVHGSALFRRGETQTLASVTLGTAQDAQRVEMLIEGTQERSFMLHYNFLPFAVGEVRAIRGVGRREIGHGYLAANSFKNVLPSQEQFPYTIRSVVDVLECNGSSSMATVCSTTMALMDAGVPLKEIVAGVAMGLVQDSSGNFHILTDILGSEDALGLMDFKVTGSEKGIRAIQMDIKAEEGLSKELMHTALQRAREARIHILNEMKKVMPVSRGQVSALAPQVTTFKIDVDKIGAVIGPSGKIIKEIIAQTEAQIDIDNNGMVNVYAKDQAAGRRAEQWIRVLAGEIKEGAVFNGIIRRFTDFGLFVELVPGKDGLIHISSIDREKQRTLSNLYRVNDPLRVRVISYERDTGRVKLVAPDLECKS